MKIGEHPKFPVPAVIRLALKILLNHVEPGWDNTKTIVKLWLAEIDDIDENQLEWDNTTRK